MFNFLSDATKNSWDEDVFQLTLPGILTVVAIIILLLGIAMLIRKKESNKNVFSAKQLVFSAIAMALALVTSYIKFLNLPFGGSCTLFSMFFITLVGYWYGVRVGLMTAISYGLLQFVLDPVFYYPTQLLIDYPLAFGALGLSGLFSQKKHGLILGYLTGVCGRFVFAFLSGIIFFGHYAPEGWGIAAYSAIYNGSYIFTEAAFTIVLLLVPAVYRGFDQVKRMALES